MSKRRIVVAIALSMTLVATPAVFSPRLRLIWNASASVPVGLYSVHPSDRIAVEDLVAVHPSDDLARFLAERGYLPLGVPLIKRVLALPGTKVCREGSEVSVDGHIVGVARDRDQIGRDLPRWQGCRVIAVGEVFLMNRNVSDSLDGRYFGPLPVSSVTARLTPLWTDEDGDGRFEWRAGAP